VTCDPVPNGNGGCTDYGSEATTGCVSIDRARSLGGLIDDMWGPDMFLKIKVLEKYGPIHSWNTSLVTDMSYIFSGHELFNGDLSKWATTQVTTMKRMFAHYDSMDMVWAFGEFKRTMCGGAWQSLSGDNSFNTVTNWGTETQGRGKIGCCASGTFMSSPELNPFSQSGSCSVCALTDVENDETSCGSSCPGGTFGIEPSPSSYSTISGTSFTPHDFRQSYLGGQGNEELFYSINGNTQSIQLHINCDTAVNCAAGIMQDAEMITAILSAVDGNLVMTARFNYQASTMSILPTSDGGDTSGPNALALFGTNPIVHDVSATATCQICVAGKFNEQGGASCKNCPSGNYSTAQQSSCDYDINSCPTGTLSVVNFSC